MERIKERTVDKKPYRTSSILLALLALISSAVYAQGGKDVQDDGNMANDGMMSHGFMHKADGGGHGWKSGLTDEQQAEIDWITLRVSQKQQLLGAQIAVKEAELNQLIVGEDVTQEQWHAKLDELLQLKREYMINKYQRLIEVRQVLTPQQRVAFDLEVLSR
jgi:Spy/CpxP family protein refolding chaperone